MDNPFRFLPGGFFAVFCTVADFAFNKTDGVGNDGCAYSQGKSCHYHLTTDQAGQEIGITTWRNG